LNVDGTGKLKEDIILKNLQKSIEGKEMKSFLFPKYFKCSNALKPTSSQCSKKNRLNNFEITEHSQKQMISFIP